MAKFRVEKVERMVEESAADVSYLNTEEVAAGLVRPPRSQRFTKSRAVGFLWLWVVFDHQPETDDGYVVVFDPRQNRYGLATKPQGTRHGSFDGFCGYSLEEALKSM